MISLYEIPPAVHKNLDVNPCYRCIYFHHFVKKHHFSYKKLIPTMKKAVFDPNFEQIC